MALMIHNKNNLKINQIQYKYIFFCYYAGIWKKILCTLFTARILTCLSDLGWFTWKITLHMIVKIKRVARPFLTSAIKVKVVFFPRITYALPPARPQQLLRAVLVLNIADIPLEKVIDKTSTMWRRFNSRSAPRKLISNIYNVFAINRLIRDWNLIAKCII